MTLVRWQRAPEVRTLHNDMNRLVNELFQGGLQDKRAWKQSAWTPAVDMCESDQAFTLTAELPGFSKDDVQVEFKDNRLTLKGERKRETDVQEKQYRRVERVYGAFERSFKLPAAVDADKAEADQHHRLVPRLPTGPCRWVCRVCVATLHPFICKYPSAVVCCGGMFHDLESGISYLDNSESKGCYYACRAWTCLSRKC